ncbi:MAG: hypothetical protein Q4615_19015 [Paracoccus aminovorans]|nr:hypothetical protein [Paracoccus aminovorans]
MKLIRLTMKNFMPYKDQAVIDFPKDESQNVMLVFGDNMRGRPRFSTHFDGASMKRRWEGIPASSL